MYLRLNIYYIFCMFLNEIYNKKVGKTLRTSLRIISLAFEINVADYSFQLQLKLKHIVDTINAEEHELKLT